jgi:hypothetical protein
MRFLFTQFLLLIIFITTQNVLADELSKDTKDAIKTACHGNLIDNKSGSVSKFLFKISPICTEIQSKKNVDIDESVRRHKVHITEKDVEIFMNRDFKSLYGDKFDQECKDFLCKKRRRVLAEKNIPMSQPQYEQITKHCSNHATQEGCIEQWIDEEWVEKGVREIPSPSPIKKEKIQKSLSLGDLMSGEQEQKKASNSLANLMGNTKPSNNISPKAASIGFGDIYEGRKQIKVGKIKQSLFNKNEKIASSCQCALNKQSCFKAKSYDYSNLTKADNNTNAQLNQKKYIVCNNWLTNLRGKTSDNEEILKSYVNNSNVIMRNLYKLDKHYDQANDELTSKEKDIAYETRRREREQRRRSEQQQNSGGGFGQMFALAAVAGIAGMSDLPTDQAVEVFTNVAKDIISDSNTATNTLNMMQDAGYGSLEMEKTDFNKITNGRMDEIYAKQKQVTVNKSNKDNGNILGINTNTQMGGTHPLLQQRSIGPNILGTYYRRSYNLQQGKGALHSLQEMESEVQKSGGCVTSYSFNSGNTGSLTNSQCSQYSFNWSSTGKGNTGTGSQCDNIKMDFGGKNSYMCISSNGRGYGPGSDRFGQRYVHTQ